MARMSLDTAIRLSAEVKGGANITKVQRSLQDLAKGSQTTARQMGTLRSATFQYARANDTTIAGIRNSVAAFRGLQEQAKIGSREFTRYGTEIQRLEGKLRGLDGTAQKAGASLGRNLAAGLAAAGIGRALQGITAQAGRFDAELRKAAAIEGGAGSFGVLRKEIEAVAAAAAGTPTEVAALATALSRAGFSAKETTDSLRGIVLGAEATSVSFAEMGSIAADNMRAFGLQTAETGRVVDVLTQAANKSNQTVLDLGESMKYAAPIARDLGVPIEDLAGTLALLANNGIRGSDAGTALRTGLTRLQIAAGGADSEVANLTRGNVQLTRAMEVLGGQVLDSTGKLKPMDEVLIGLKRSFAGLSNTDRAVLSKALFGTEAGSKFQALLNSTEGSITSMMEATRNSGGVAEETQKKMQGFDYSVKVLGGNIESLTNQIGGMIGAALKPLIDGLNAAIGAAQKLPEPVKAIGVAAAAAGISVLGLVAAVAAIKATLAVVGGLSVVLGALSASFATVAGAATAAWAAITGPIGLTVLAIAGVTAAAYAMSPPFREFLDEIPGRFSTFWGELGSDANDVVQRITGLAKGLKSSIGSTVDRIGQATQGAVQSIITSAQSLVPGLQPITQGIGSLFSEAFSFIENRWQQAVANMINFSSPLMTVLKAAGIDVGSAAASAMSYQTGEKRLKAAGSTATYTVGGIAYDTATGRPVKPPPAFVRPTPESPIVNGGGAGAAAGGGGKKTDWKPSSKAQALIAAAGKLGISPLDLATLIQFESGGDPGRWGGAGGNYMGLIQFGPSERRQYGANDKQSFEEQVQGPVVRYLQDRFKGVGMSTQGADLLKLYTTVLAGNPKANPDARDSFGTSARSGVAAMLRPGAQRDVAKRKYFGGDAANAGYSQVDAGSNLVKAWEEAQQLEKLRKDGILTSARQLAILERQADVTRAITSEEKITASSDLARTERMYKFIDLLKEAQGDEQQMNVLRQQQLELDRAQLEYGLQLNDALLRRVGISGELLDQSRFTGTGSGAREQTFDLKGTLADTSPAEEKIDRLEQAAESSSQAIGGLFRDIISGTATAEESLARTFQSIADSFASMVSDMIAEWAKAQIIGLFRNVAGPIAGAVGGGFGATSGDLFGQGLGVQGSLLSFAGGGHTGSSPRSGGVDGQGGFPAILHPQETVIDHTRMMPVPYQTSPAAAATGELAVPYQSSGQALSVPFLKTGGGDGGAASMPLDNEPIRYESRIVDGVETVTKEQAEEIGRRTEQRVLKRLQNSPGARRAVGIG